MLNYQKYKRVPVMAYPEREWPNKEIEKAGKQKKSLFNFKSIF